MSRRIRERGPGAAGRRLARSRAARPRRAGRRTGSNVSGVRDLPRRAPATRPRRCARELPPTLIRRTPSSAASATVMNGALISRFTGLGATAATIAATCSSGVDPRGVEAVGARFGVGAQPADRLVDVGAADHEALGATGEQTPVPLSSIACRAARDPLDRQVEVEQRIGRVARGVLDREPGDAGRRRPASRSRRPRPGSMA